MCGPSHPAKLEEVQMTKLVRIGAMAIAMVSVMAVGPVLAATEMYRATLRGASEVPPVTGNGMGTVEAAFDTVTRPSIPLQRSSPGP
jgi:hypothetical protein